MTRQSNNSAWWWALAAALVALVVVYFDTFRSMTEKWESDAAFNYGFAIAPISLWLAWRHRAWLREIEFRTSWAGVAALLGAAMLWIIARGTGVLVVEQFAAVAMIPALVLTILGWGATRTLMFPLAYLFFLVPVGRGLVPWLVDVTADFATVAVQASGIPVYRSHALLIIPGGWFEVAKACSGVSFLMTAFALGVLYGYVNYTSWKKRLIAVALAVTVPILANGVRVYLIIAVSHLTDMRFGPGSEHVVFGRVFFIAVLLGMFWIGRRWHDDPMPAPSWLSRDGFRVPGIDRTAPVAWAPALVAAPILLAAPPYQAAFAVSLQQETPNAASNVRLPDGSEGWRGPATDPAAWRPLYSGAVAQKQGRYVGPDNLEVDAFVAVYGLGATNGAEMISYGNMLYAAELDSVPVVELRTVSVGNAELTVGEVAVPDGGAGRLVWYWYVVGNRVATDPFAVKALEAIAWITRGARTDRIITLATPMDDRAADRLESFVRAHADCVASAFHSDGCNR
jgi:exosortase A